MSDNNNELINDKEHTLEMLKLITSSEHHFNNLCFKIRALASTWLLATFGGVGWILKDMPASINQESVIFDKLDLSIALCFGCTIGIVVLWILDIKVYQQLLNVWFDSREKYEIDDRFPTIRHDMKSLFKNGRAVDYIIYYYLALVAAPLVLALYLSVISSQSFLTGAIIILLLLVLTVIYVYSPKDR